MTKTHAAGRTRRAALAILVGAIVLGSSGCTPAEEQPEDPSAGTTSTPFTLDAHAHIGSCDLFDREPTCTAGQPGEPPESCDPGEGLVTTSEEYLAVYPDAADGSGARLAQIHAMAYQWSSPDVAGTDYDASPQETANVQCENDYVAQQAALYPDRLLPFCSVNPKKSYAVDEIARCAADLDAAGLKMHFSSSQVDVRDEQTRQWLIEVLQAAAAADLPAVLHFGDLAVLCDACDAGAELDEQAMADAMAVMLEDVLPAAPGLRLTFAHATGVGNFPSWTQATFRMLIDAYSTNPDLRQVDVYVDLAAVFTTSSMVNGNVPAPTDADLAVLGELLTEWGLDRVFWGSDLETDAFTNLEQMWSATGLSAADLDRIAAANGADFRNGG